MALAVAWLVGCSATLAIASDDPNRPAAGAAPEGEGGPLVPETLPLLYGLGSQSRAIAMYKTQAVIGQGTVLSVWFVADKCGPWFVCSTVLPGIIEQVTIEGDTAYVALGDAGFAAVHVEEVNAPTVLAVVPTQGFCYGAAPVGKRLCVADGQGGLLIYDVSSPAAPSLIGSVPGDIRAVAPLGDKAVCLDWQAGLLVVDLESAATAGQVSQLQSCQALAVSGSIAYVADQLGGLFVVDLKGQTAPQVVGQTQLASPAQALGVAGERVAAAIGSAGMQLIDVSNPSQPVPCAAIPLAGECVDLAVNDLGVYVADPLLGVYDFKLPDGCQIFRRRAISIGMTPLDVAVDGNEAYVAGGPLGLFSWDMAGPTPPNNLVRFEVDVQAVAVSNQRAYLACGTEGLKVLDLSEPPWPRELSSSDMGGFCSTVACEGGIVMVGTGDFVKILDVTDPCRPSQRAAWPAEGKVLGITMSQGLGFVACASQGLVILQNDGTVAGAFDTPGVAYDVAVSDGIAYIADGPAGVQVIDVHNTNAPVLITTIPTPGPAYAVAADGNDLYVAGRFGAWKLDICNPAAPVIRAVSSIPANGVSVALSTSAVLVADPEAGLMVLGR